MSDGETAPRWYYQKPAAAGGFASRLREARMDRGMKQSELADAVGIHQSKISSYERGEIQHPNPATLVAMAQALGLPDSTFTDLAGWPSAADLVARVPPEGALVVRDPAPGLGYLVTLIVDNGLTGDELDTLRQSLEFIIRARDVQTLPAPQAETGEEPDAEADQHASSA